MNATLFTQSEDCQLSLKSIRLCGDGSEVCCLLEVVSYPFAASVAFIFDCSSLSEFVAALESLYTKLVGEAKLEKQYEETYLSLRGNGRGQIVVSGVLSMLTEHSQRLEFEFVTDQTSLPPFIADLQAVWMASHP
ncbi:WapI family immunity protein [Thiolinea disciformis]|uniref:WapI family immunity protein n=1 Tax=Thiolinea disciformis TaxID=125614 RepID=UPI00037ED777|nr:hypothetical protein [Thiolinea disciformis]